MTKQDKRWKAGSISDWILLPYIFVVDSFPVNNGSWEAKFLGMRLAELSPLCGCCVKRQDWLGRAMVSDLWGYVQQLSVAWAVN